MEFNKEKYEQLFNEYLNDDRIKKSSNTFKIKLFLQKSENSLLIAKQASVLARTPFSHHDCGHAICGVCVCRACRGSLASACDHSSDPQSVAPGVYYSRPTRRNRPRPRWRDRALPVSLSPSSPRSTAVARA